jgi:hypothetical protein
LVIGSEVSGDRPWKGKIFYVAIFDRALAEQEIHQNYVSRLRSINKGSKKHSSIKAKGPVASEKGSAILTLPFIYVYHCADLKLKK